MRKTASQIVDDVIIKIAAEFVGPTKPGMGPTVPPIAYSPEEWSNMLEASQGRAADLERTVQSEREFSQQLSGHRAKAEAALARSMAERQAETAANQRLLGELGKQHNLYRQNLGAPVRWFGELKPWQKGLTAGGAALGLTGLGAGLGYALSD